MKELHQKQIAKRRLYSTPVLVALLILTGLIIRSTYNIAQKYLESAEHVDTLEQKANDLLNRETKLKTDIVRMGTDEGIDTEIKEKFNVVKDGGRVAVIVDEVNRASSTEIIKLPWYKKLWNAIIS